MRHRVGILVVDDSPVDRELLIAILNNEPDFEVLGQAADAYEAREKIRTLNPGVMTLDVSMPGMHGLQFLRNVMRLRPMPVVMCSALTDAGAAVTLEALAIGAVDFVRKPGSFGLTMAEYQAAIVEKVRAAAIAKVRTYENVASNARASDVTAGAMARPRPHADETGRATKQSAVDVIAVGASTGGVSAIEALLDGLGSVFVPPIVVTQHIPAGFSRTFAERLHAKGQRDVKEAVDGMPLVANHVYVAPGGQQLAVQRGPHGYQCHVTRGPRVNLHRPSVEVLFHSVAEHVGPRAIGVMLTGMGADGAAGLLAMREAGSYNLVQDEASSVVWGMPGAAAKLGAAHKVLPLEQIAPTLTRRVNRGVQAAPH